MKFVELKNSLTKSVEKIYLIVGDDTFAVSNANALIEKALNLSFPEINKIVYDENKVTLKAVLDSAMMLPFGDNKRLNVITEYKSTNSKEEAEMVKSFLGKDTYNCFVFNFFTENEFSKKIKDSCTFVDAGRLDDTTIKKWILSKFSKSAKEITVDALNLFVNYCNGYMSRISVETEKLISIQENPITNKEIEFYVTPDKEYQIYELTEALASGKSKLVFDIVNNIMNKEKNPIGLVQFLYNSFRRLFLISLSGDTDEQLSKDLGIKPYAVKMARIQAKKFTIKQLKRINLSLAELDVNLKSGKMNQNVAVEYAICNILQMR